MRNFCIFRCIQIQILKFIIKIILFSMTYRLQNYTHIRVHVDHIQSPVKQIPRRLIKYTQSQTIKQRKKNILLNDFQDNIGYPQQILIKSQRHHLKDYNNLNIKKIQQKPGIVTQRKVIINKLNRNLDPKIILGLKKMADKKKINTKINLKNQQFFNAKVVKVSPKHKNSQNLRNNSSKQQKLFTEITKRNTQNITGFKLYTQSFMLKRSITQKKKAYYEVFGQQAEARYTTPLRSNTIYNSEQKHRKRKKKSGRMVTHNQTQRKKFSQTINKLEFYDDLFEQNIKKEELNQQINKIIQKQIQKKSKLEVENNNLLQNIKRLNKTQGLKRFNKNYSHIENMEDLQKIDPIFTKQLKNHKQKKIRFMKKQLQITSKRLSHSKQNSIELEDKFQSFYLSKNNQEKKELQKLYIPQPDQKIKRLKNLQIQKFEKIRFFLRNLFQVRDQALRYGIPMKYLYSGVFQTIKHKYKLQGSYIFYKAISSNNIQTVVAFVRKCPLLLYQIDQYGQTPLLAACRLNYEEQVIFFIQQGVNLDALNYEGKMSLYYAIENNNERIVKNLLMKGASPWSNKYCNITQLIKNSQIKSMIQNARKVSIALKLTKIGQRNKVWQKMKHMIKQSQ